MFGFDYEEGREWKHEDRAVALMCASTIEEALKVALRTHFVELTTDEDNHIFCEDQDSPLATFSSKIRLGYAMGVYGPKTRDDLNIMRYVRNVFAHTRNHVTFNTEEIASACNYIAVTDRCKGSEYLYPSPTTPRGRYVCAAKLWSIYLFSLEGNPPRKYFEAIPNDWRPIMA